MKTIRERIVSGSYSRWIESYPFIPVLFSEKSSGDTERTTPKANLSKVLWIKKNSESPFNVVFILTSHQRSGQLENAISKARKNPGHTKKQFKGLLNASGLSEIFEGVEDIGYRAGDASAQHITMIKEPKSRSILDRNKICHKLKMQEEIFMGTPISWGPGMHDLLVEEKEKELPEPLKVEKDLAVLMDQLSESLEMETSGTSCYGTDTPHDKAGDLPSASQPKKKKRRRNRCRKKAVVWIKDDPAENTMDQVD